MIVLAKNFSGIRITGPNARSLLERILTNRVAPKGQGNLQMLLSHQGRIEGAAYLISTEADEWIGFGGKALIEGMAEGVRKYRLRDAVEVQLIDIDCYVADAAALPVLGVDAPSTWSSEHLALLLPAQPERPLFIAGPGWFGQTVWVLVAKGWPQPEWTKNATMRGLIEANQHRVALGWPELGYEVELGDLPLEWDLGWAVAQKGCYIGQEVVERMVTRARRSRHRALISEDDSLADGPAVRRPEWAEGDFLGLRKVEIEGQWDGPLSALPLSLRLPYREWAEKVVGRKIPPKTDA